MTDKQLTARILIVDDKPENVRLLEMMLSNQGYTNLTTTTNSLDVIPAFEEEPFDLILLDIRMPHLDGFQIMEQLSERVAPDDYLPILVLTAQQDQETRQTALGLGAKDFLTKPFDRVEVLNRIRNILDVRMLYNERQSQAALLEHEVEKQTQALQDRNLDLENTRLEIIRRLGRAGEYRDNETGMHVIRMSKFCEQLALAANLSEEFATSMLHASPMHDVGKIGIPDHILLKPGKFDPKEWEIMKTHAEIGCDIIGDSNSSLMQLAKSIAISHHEKWDGSGYPRGLKGDQIPIEGRITAVCDVFDALTSERPYKQAWKVDEALDYIIDNSGRHFDPYLVERFQAIYPVILDIRSNHPDEAELIIARQ